jgi:hypothetical protein
MQNALLCHVTTRLLVPKHHNNEALYHLQGITWQNSDYTWQSLPGVKLGNMELTTYPSITKMDTTTRGFISHNQNASMTMNLDGGTTLPS